MKPHRFGKPVYARGSTKPGEMNQTEAKYAQYLELLRLDGEILWWKYEAIKFRLAPKTFLMTDFLVMKADGLLECHEVKGHMEDDAAVKLKVAADIYPFRFLLITVRPKREGGGWVTKEI